MNIHEILKGIGLGTVNNRLHFGTDPNPGSHFLNCEIDHCGKSASWMLDPNPDPGFFNDSMEVCALMSALIL